MLIGDDDGAAGWVHIRGGGGVGWDDDGCYGMLEALVRLEMRCRSDVQLYFSLLLRRGFTFRAVTGLCRVVMALRGG